MGWKNFLAWFKIQRMSIGPKPVTGLAVIITFTDDAFF